MLASFDEMPAIASAPLSLPEFVLDKIFFKKK
jgi:hypothetical protein